MKRMMNFKSGDARRYLNDIRLTNGHRHCVQNTVNNLNALTTYLGKVVHANCCGSNAKTCILSEYTHHVFQKTSNREMDFPFVIEKLIIPKIHP